jgi:antitoxin MazE
MKTRVQKWGNSLALRIPKSFAEEVGLQTDSSVELSLREGKLVIASAARRRPSLKSLLAKVTKANVHREVESGQAVGREAW